MSSTTAPLIWIDLEMTGLQPKTDRILELAVLLTDANLEIIAEGPVLAIHQKESILMAMDAWNTQHHQASGLVSRVQKSQWNEAHAEQEVLRFLSAHVSAKQSPLCGNSIYQDRRFLAEYMPQLESYFHYRNIDVSTLKELARRWAPSVYEGVKKAGKHAALDDIKESIEELRYYRKHFIFSAS